MRMVGTRRFSEAKTQLSRMIDRVAAGEDIVISRHGRPVARLCQLSAARPKVELGILKGGLEISADFDAPLPDDVLVTFEGRG